MPFEGYLPIYLRGSKHICSGGEFLQSLGNMTMCLVPLNFISLKATLPSNVLMHLVVMAMPQHENWFHLSFSLGIHKVVSVDRFTL